MFGLSKSRLVEDMACHEYDFFKLQIFEVTIGQRCSLSKIWFFR